MSGLANNSFTVDAGVIGLGAVHRIGIFLGLRFPETVQLCNIVVSKQETTRLSVHSELVVRWVTTSRYHGSLISLSDRYCTSTAL
jgi:hypothetical protein